MSVHFSLVPPPDKAPWDEAGARHGLVRGLRVDNTERQYRCASCGNMQPPGPVVLVPQGVRKHDPVWSVEEAARRSAYNGHFSGWCLTCAPKENPELVTVSSDSRQMKSHTPLSSTQLSWWGRLKRRMSS